MSKISCNQEAGGDAVDAQIERSGTKGVPIWKLCADDGFTKDAQTSNA